jgi:pyruvate ferredoxin oxidoreductase alpha subunit
MLKQIEGSKAVAETVSACRPQVICAYPISPQTHIVEALDEYVREGLLSGCEFINVESEFSAMSVAIGSSAAGSRVYTATASQGLLFMVEPVFNASGLGLPIVMTVANRAIGSPINIWNDQSDAMSQRDSGWIQLYAQDNQSAADLHILAFRLAEELSLPVMVCMDGFILTHAMEEIDVAAAEDVAKFLPPFVPRQSLDVNDPVSIGAMVGPEAFTEVKYLGHFKQIKALEVIPELSAEFKNIFARAAGGEHDFNGLLSEYKIDDAEIILVALGSIIGTIKDVIDEKRSKGVKVGVMGITSFRPFPSDEVRKRLKHGQKIVVVERAFAPGIGGIVSSNIRTALSGIQIDIRTVVAGLGGRPVTTNTVSDIIEKSIYGELPEFSFSDLNVELVERELERNLSNRRSGPMAENLLKDLGGAQ